MASRAATLAKPKPKVKSKPKATAKDITSKSLVAKSPASAKTSAAAPASKAPTKATSSKATVSKAPTAKAAAAKPVAVKPSLNKVAKPSSLSQPAALNKPGALKIKPKGPAEDAAVIIGGAASFEPAAPKPRRRGKGEIRTRIYWAVFNQSLRRVAVFEFDQRAEAEKRAAKLAKASGDHHFIQKIKAIVQ